MSAFTSAVALTKSGGGGVASVTVPLSPRVQGSHLLTPVVSETSAMPETITTVDLEDESDRWRFTCPRGHRDWEPTNNHFWCAACARTLADQVDPEFEQLHDKRESRQLAREEVRLMYDAGSYRDLYKGGETA